MAVPAGDGKLAFAAGLAAGLAYVALRQNNPVRVVILSDTSRLRVSPLLRHVQRLPELLQFLAGLEAEGPTSTAARALLDRVFLVSRLELVSFAVIIALMVFKPGSGAA